MIRLGVYDPQVSPAALDAYIKYAKHLTRVDEWRNALRGEAENEWLGFEKIPDGEMTVAEVQTFLKEAGFFPFGKIDGICGYRTNSSIRLFQEYIRTVEGDPSIGTPDGKFGKISAGHVRRWQQNNKRADWADVSATNPSPEALLWLNLLNQIKQTQLATPSAQIRLVNAYTGPTDTIKPAQWDFDPQKIHLIGVRCNEGVVRSAQHFDDIFILLINGLVFKFWGSTDPGATESPKGLPFLVEGQHRYRFGWHLLSKQKRVYHALKPARHGVLVIRSKDSALTDADLARGLEPNLSINIHWGGEGVGNVGSWSEGCQVFVGKSYINHQGKLIDCSHFAASNYSGLGQKAGGIYQTKGAYTILTDLVAAFSGANADDNTVYYTLINERDLTLAPDLGANKAKNLLAQFK